MQFSTKNVLTDDMRALLTTVLWGTPNHGALYRILNVDFFAAFAALHFHTLRDEKDRLVAMRYFHAHSLRAGGHELQAIYHSFSAVQPDLQGQGYGGQLAARSADALTSLLGDQPGMIYAYVERENQRNINNLLKAGYHVLGEFWALAFASLKLKPSVHVRAAQPTDAPQLNLLYKEFYAEYSFVADQEDFSAAGYYVYEKNGEILAALHAKPLHWSIARLGFPGDRLVLKLIMQTPGLKILFPASDLRFLKMGNLCYLRDHPEPLRDLILGVLSLNGRHSALAYIDKKSFLATDLKRIGLLGWLNRLTETPVRILGRFQNTPVTLQNEFRRRPKTFSIWNL